MLHAYTEPMQRWMATDATGTHQRLNAAVATMRSLDRRLAIPPPGGRFYLALTRGRPSRSRGVHAEQHRARTTDEGWVAPRTGIEPVTFRLGGERSIP